MNRYRKLLGDFSYIGFDPYDTASLHRDALYDCDDIFFITCRKVAMMQRDADLNWHREEAAAHYGETL
jgi:hypothetical protein